MCGRFAFFSSPNDYINSVVDGESVFCCEDVENYNAYPTQHLPVLYRNKDDELKCDSLYWGLVPAWSKQAGSGFNTSNARSETAADKPSFRHAFKQQRCLVPVNGWYEWTRVGKDKQPYYHHSHDTAFILLAGLWDNWINPETGESLTSFSILTQDASGKALSIHKRMPVTIQSGKILPWLDNQLNNKHNIYELMQNPSDLDIEIYPVSKEMNSPRHQGIHCIKATGQAI